MPTETVYGLAADATNAQAVAAVFQAKGRPAFNPLIVHVTDAAAAARLGHFDDRALALSEQFWPGPLTLVVPRRANAAIADLTSAGLASLALRVPAHPAAQALLEAADRPLAAPSANRSGAISPTTAAHVEAEFGGDLPVLDGGPCQAGIESTIVAIGPGTVATLLRPGAITSQALEAVIGPLAKPSGTAIEAPGMLASHYAPAARVRLNALAAEPGELLLGFGTIATAGGLNLSPEGNLLEAAANLYAHLRSLDAKHPKGIAVAPIPTEGLGEAINDRLTRAAAPR